VASGAFLLPLPPRDIPTLSFSSDPPKTAQLTSVSLGTSHKWGDGVNRDILVLCPASSLSLYMARFIRVGERRCGHSFSLLYNIPPRERIHFVI
jgi:hypothetical protein